MHPTYFKRPLFIFFILLSLFLVLNKEKVLTSPSIKELRIGQFAEVEGKLYSFPYKTYKGKKTAFIVKTSAIDGKKSKGLVLVNTDAEVDAPPSAKLKISGRVAETRYMNIEGSFNRRDYLLSKSVGAEIRADKVEVIGAANFVRALAYKIRRAALSCFQKSFNAENSALISGIALGEKSGVSDAFSQALRDAGVMHLLVASGSNVGFVAVIVYFLCSFLYLRRRTSIIIALFACGFYVLCAGADTPLLRAYLMTVFVCAGFILKRESGIFHGLITAGTVILLMSPSAIFDISFQLSFLATAGIVFAFSAFSAFGKSKLIQFISAVFIASAGAQLAILPILISAFHRVSVISFVSNIFLVPLSGIIMAGGFALSLFSFLQGTAVFAFLAGIINFILEIFKFLVYGFGSLEFSAFYFPSLNFWQTGLYYSVLLSAVFLPVKIMRAVFLKPAVAVAVLFALSGLLVKRGKVYSFDYRGNKAVIVKSYGGELLVLNASADGKVLANAVLANGRKTADAVLFTSRNAKDYRGLKNFVEIIKVKNIIVPFGILDDNAQDAVDFAVSRGAVVARVWQGEGAAFGGLRAVAQWGENAGFSGNNKADGISYEIDDGIADMHIGNAVVGKLKSGGEQFDIIPLKDTSGGFTYSKRRINALEV